MRNRIAPLALFVAFAPGCVEESELESDELQADSAALDDLDDLDGAPFEGDSEYDDEADDSLDPGADIDELVAESSPVSACIDCYSNVYTSFNSGGCPYASCFPGDVSLGCFNGVRTCLEQICFPVAANGSIDASPQTVRISGGTGTTNVSWSGCAGTNEVWVSHNGAAETLFARDGSGNQNAPWIQIGHTYDFCLYEGTAHTNQLDCVTVTGEYQAPPQSCFETGCPFGQHCCDFDCRPLSLQCD